MMMDLKVMSKIPHFFSVLILLGCSELPSDVLWQRNFDEPWLASLNSGLTPSELKVVVADEGVANSHALKVLYRGSARGSERVVERYSFLPVSAAQLNFSVKFCQNFDFAKGGKLHGLGPRDPVTGGDKVAVDGWSVRLMWRQNGALQTYIYHQDMQGKYGDTARAADFHFEPGRYYHVELAVSLNTPGEADGKVVVKIDDVVRIVHTGLRFRDQKSDASLISKFLFSTFHGGSSPAWAPRNNDGSFKTDCAYFDDFSITAGKRNAGLLQ
jgi:hypothetical protein